MYDAMTIADEILRIAKKKGKALTPLQLMKLVYIAHGWSLGLYNRDLFGDRIEAWKYGPVIPGLYHATKSYGRSEIPLSLVIDDASVVDEHTKQLLEWIFGSYGHLNGIQLSAKTHEPGTPWAQVYTAGSFNAEITDDLIREHYRKLAHERGYSITAH